ncbi:MAG TPA: cell division protein SepF, partial [Candidatus Limnocylindria bacterium]|nr:cell division protein SepF [Candidatus Limnocylindria bacterium]
AGTQAGYSAPYAQYAQNAYAPQQAQNGYAQPGYPQQGNYPPAQNAAGYAPQQYAQQYAPVPQPGQYAPQGYPGAEAAYAAQSPYAAPQAAPQPAPQQARQGYAPIQSTAPQHMQLNQGADSAPRSRRAAQHDARTPQPEGNIVPFPGVEQAAPAPEPRQMDAYVVNVTGINGCRQAMTCLRKGQCTLVVMDQLADKAEVRRYVDMLNGACFALGGTMTRLSLKVGFYLLAPSGMMVYTDPLTASANAPQAAPQGTSQAAYAQPGMGQAAGAPSAAQWPAPGAYAPPAQQPSYAYPQAPFGAGAPQAQAQGRQAYAPQYANEVYEEERAAL